MHYLTEDPSYFLIGFGLAVVGCLVAMKATQQGKFLIWAGALAAVAAALFAFEQFYVTDAERIEAVVYDMADAIERSDADRIKSHLDDNVTLGMRGRTFEGSMTLRLVLNMITQTHFDFVRVGQLATAAGRLTKRGSAEFKVTANGTFNQNGTEFAVAPVATEWSLGFTERPAGVWKVNRITAIRLPGDAARAIFGR